MSRYINRIADRHDHPYRKAEKIFFGDFHTYIETTGDGTYRIKTPSSNINIGIDGSIDLSGSVTIKNSGLSELYAESGLTTTSWSGSQDYYNHSSNSTIHYTKASIDLTDLGDVSDTKATDEYLQWDGSGWATSSINIGSDIKYFSAYDGSGTTVITTSWTDIPFNKTIKKDSDYTFTNGNSIIELGSGSFYKISYDVTVHNNSLTTDRFCETRIMYSSSSDWAIVPGTCAATPILSNKTKSTASCTTMMEFSTSDHVKIQCKSDHDTEVTTYPSGTRINIERI